MGNTIKLMTYNSPAIKAALDIIGSAGAAADQTAQKYLGQAQAGATQQKQANIEASKSFTLGGEAAFRAYNEALGLNVGSWSEGTAGVASTPTEYEQREVYSPEGGRRFVQTDKVWRAGTPGVAAVAPVYTPGVAVSPETILSRFQNSPGYQAMLQSGLAGINTKASSSGLLGSGAQAKALTRYAADYADQGFNKYLGNLLSSANVGASAVQGTIQANTGLQSGITSAASSLGGTAANAAAQAQIEKGNLAAKWQQIPGQ